MLNAQLTDTCFISQCNLDSNFFCNCSRFCLSFFYRGTRAQTLHPFNDDLAANRDAGDSSITIRNLHHLKRLHRDSLILIKNVDELIRGTGDDRLCRNYYRVIQRPGNQMNIHISTGLHHALGVLELSFHADSAALRIGKYCR